MILQVVNAQNLELIVERNVEFNSFELSKPIQCQLFSFVSSGYEKQQRKALRPGWGEHEGFSGGFSCT